MGQAKCACGRPLPAPGKTPRRRLLRLTEHLLAVIGLALLVFHAGFNLSRMASGSMSPTLRGEGAHDGDWVLTEKVSYWLRPPRRWEAIAFVGSDGNQVIKRVVGLPGERVSLADGEVLINGEPVPRPPGLEGLLYLAHGNLRGGREADCGDGWFVLGDHSRDSCDSRWEGPVRPGQLIGRAWLVLWPWSRIQSV